MAGFTAVLHDRTRAWCRSPAERAPKNVNLGLGLSTFYAYLERNLTWLGFYSRSLIATFHKGWEFDAAPHNRTRAWCCSPAERAPKNVNMRLGLSTFYAYLERNLTWLGFYSRSLIATFYKGWEFDAAPHNRTRAWCCSPAERADPVIHGQASAVLEPTPHVSGLSGDWLSVFGTTNPVLPVHPNGRHIMVTKYS